MKHIKIVVVGDSMKIHGEDKGSEKTQLLISYVTSDNSGEYVPTVFDNLIKNITFEDQAIELQLWDTAGQEDYPKLRPLSYPQTDIFIFLFSLVSPTSLEDVENIWLPEIKLHCPKTKYILVGTNSELRDSFNDHLDEYKSKGWEPIPKEKGEEMQRKIKAIKYIECDSYSKYNLNEVFNTAIEVVLHKIKFQDDDGKSHKVSKFKQWKEKRKEKKSKKD